MKNAWEFAPCDIRKSFECQICVDEVPPKSIRKLECNHHFCVECLTGYLEVTLKDGGLVGNAINCPGFKCKFELEDRFVLGLLEEEQLKGKYLQIIANSFVQVINHTECHNKTNNGVFQNNRFMKWCPNANCQSAVQLDWFDSSIYRESVRCGCGISFCFKCHELSHDPVECSLLREWAKVKAEDFEVQSWILHNTKPCPKCRVNIQKNGGCMHITCKCRYEFCWVCMGKWARGHSCAANNIVTPSERGLQNIRRFTTYNAKHETMNQAYQFDVAQYKQKLEAGTTELELEKQWVKVEFVAKAVEILLQCRRTLMFSYIFSYFMTTLDNQMEIFEQNLVYLEQYTEQLSEHLEIDVKATNLSHMKEKIINSSSLCIKSLRNLMDHINEGYEDNWWRRFPIPVEELLAAVDEDVIHGLLG
jgi:ariadne-1